MPVERIDPGAVGRCHCESPNVGARPWSADQEPLSLPTLGVITSL